MTLQERIEQTKKWFAELENIENDMERAKEWRDAAYDMHDYGEYRQAVIRLLVLERRSILIRLRLSSYWFSKEDEQRFTVIQKELLFR